MRQQTKSKIKTIHMSNLSKVLGLELEVTCNLYRRLKLLETEGHKIAEGYCNGDINSEQVIEIGINLADRLNDILKDANREVIKNIQFNWDPRGYFLKINDEYVRKNKLRIETDWGGYGILCPELK